MMKSLANYFMNHNDSDFVGCNESLSKNDSQKVERLHDQCTWIIPILIYRKFPRMKKNKQFTLFSVFFCSIYVVHDISNVAYELCKHESKTKRHVYLPFYY